MQNGKKYAILLAVWIVGWSRLVDLLFFFARKNYDKFWEVAYMATAKNIAETVRELIAPVAEELSLLLWDVEFVKEGARRVLRVTIDSEEGITIDDCERMHRAIDPVLDEADPIETAYDLEVSSPGIERDLRTDMHIDWSVGEEVEVRFFAPVNGQKSVNGILAGRDEAGNLLIEIDGEVVAFARSAVAKISTVFEF